MSAQSVPSDTAFVNKAKQNAYRIYIAAIGDQDNLLNGSEYKEHITPADATGIPYFGSDDWVDGNVSYDSGLYKKVPLLYDLVTDKLVVEQPFSHFKLELISEKVKYFELPGHRFVRIVTFKNDSAFRSGFYEELYVGKVKAYARRAVERKEVPHSTGLDIEYNNKDKWYIFKDNEYHKVYSRASVMALFKDRKKALRKKMRAYPSKIDFRQRRDAAMIITSRLYDESAQ